MTVSARIINTGNTEGDRVILPADDLYREERVLERGESAFVSASGSVEVRSEHGDGRYVGPPVISTRDEVLHPVRQHPAVSEKLLHFDFSHLKARGRPHLVAVSKRFHDLAHEMALRLEGPQVAIGLQHLLAAKDCLVRAAVTDADRAEDRAAAGA